MRVSLSGYNYCHEATYCMDRPNGAEQYILLIIRSPACITENGHVRHIKGNNVVIYRKGSPHRYSSDNTVFVNDWVQFELDEEELAYYESIGIQFDTIMEFSDVYPLSNYIQLMFIERWEENPFGDESKVLLMRLLLLKLADLISKKTDYPSKYSMLLKVLKQQIYAYPNKKYSIEKICKSMSISPSYLHLNYKKLFGTTIKADVIASRVEYSKYLLTYTEHTVATISHMVGYDNDVHFMYLFKKETGYTPTQYRTAAGKINKTTNFSGAKEYPTKAKEK